MPYIITSVRHLYKIFGKFLVANANQPFPFLFIERSIILGQHENTQEYETKFISMI